MTGPMHLYLMDVRQQVPQAVRDPAERLCGSVRSGDVRLTQRGCMRQDSHSGWMSFMAQQTISTTACALDWRARTGPAGVVSVRDALVDGMGVRVCGGWGFPPAHAESPALTRGEVMRYLAELGLAPAAILGKTSLRWRSGGPDRLNVSVTLSSDGRTASIFAPDRQRDVGADSRPAP